MTGANELPTVQFRRHKTAYTVAALVTLALAGMFYFIYRSENAIIAWVLLLMGLLLSVYCARNALSNTVILELSSDGIKYKQYHYSWDRLQSYAIREENDGDSSFTYLVLNLKKSKVPLEIQLDWIDDQDSVRYHMGIFAQTYDIELEK